MAAGLHEKLRTLDLTDAAIDGASKGYGHALHSGTAPTGQAQAPKLSDPVIQSLADETAEKYNLPTGLLHAVGLQEGGRVNTPDGKPNPETGRYGVGPFQVTIDTGRQVLGKPNLTEAELRDPSTNAEAAGKYLNSLVEKHGGDVQAALGDYFGHGKDGNGQTTDKYVAQVMAKLPQVGTNQDASSPMSETPLKTADAIKQGTITIGDMDTLRGLGGAAKLLDGNHSVKQIEDMAAKNKNANQESVGRVLNWLGDYIDERYNAKQQAINDQKANNAVAKQKLLEEVKHKADDAEEAKVNSYFDAPDSYKFNPDDHILDQSPMELKQYLVVKGIKVPADIAALQGVARLELDPAEAAQKLYAHQSKMSRQQVMAYVKQFLNPAYDESTWDDKKQFAKDLGNSSIGKAGGQLISIDRTSQHLQVLDEAANMLQNGQLKDMNSVKNWVANKLGYSGPNVFDTVAQIVQTEVSKVAHGGVPTQGEIEALAKRLNDSNSPNQIRDVINSEINLMSGAYNAINQKVNDYYKYDNPHIKPSEQTAKLYGMRGQDVPGYGKPIYDRQGNIVGLGKANQQGQTVPTLIF
jgi:hypothetical protein